MTKDKLVNQHVLEYEARLKHIRELYDRAHKATEHLISDQALREKLTEFEQKKSELEQKIEDAHEITAENWREETVQQAGPMAVWDILAQQLEDFVEQHES